MNKKDLIAYLNEYLNLDSFVDKSQNWLQVDNSKKDIKKIWYAVDASDYIFDKAIKENVDMVLVHHGEFWSDEKTIVGLHYNRIKKLILNDLALYAVHLPLDANPILGNNTWIKNAFIDFFDLKDWDYVEEWFWEYNWKKIWFGLRLEEEILLDDIVVKFTESLWFENTLYNFADKRTIKSICFSSGVGKTMIWEANEDEYDLFLTGESGHSWIVDAKDLKQSVLLCGHYETEKIWVSLLAKHINEMFGIEIVYLDEKY